MRERPAGLTETDLLSALRAGWRIEAGQASFLPVGAGSYHWSITERWFAKVDDLGFTPDGREPEFARLRRSLETAVSLGLDFVLAPVPDQTGAALRRLSPRYGLSLYPLLEGGSGPFAPHPSADRPEIVEMLARLHDSPAHDAPRTTLALPGRESLEAALSDLHDPWSNGPYSEQARALLSARESDVRQWLAEFDRLVAAVRESATGWVLTHGEPHPGNFLQTATGRFLIDWDTVAVAPPERDLWMLTDRFAALAGAPPDGADQAILARYTELTGRPVSADGLALYPVCWRLADIAIFVDELRRGEDLPDSLTYLSGYLGVSARGR